MDQQDPFVVQYFKGHNGSITSLCFSPSGRHLASSSDDHSFLVWNLTSNTGSLRYKAKAIPVTHVTYSPVGTHIASSQGDFVRLWVSSVQGKSTEFKAHLGTVRSVEFSPDGEKLLTSSNDKSVKLWMTSRRKFLTSMSGHTNWVRMAKFSPNASMIVSCSDDKTVRLWDPATSKLIHTFPELKGIARYVDFHPSNTCIGVASSHNVAKLYDLRTLKLLQYYPCHTSNVNSLAFHPSGTYMITGSDDKTNKVIDLLEGRVTLTLEAHSKPVTAVAFSKSGDLFSTASEDKNVLVWKSNLSFEPMKKEENRKGLRESINNNTEPKRPNIKLRTSDININKTLIEDVYSAKDYEEKMTDDDDRRSQISALSDKENCYKNVNPKLNRTYDDVLSLLDTLTHDNDMLQKRVQALEEKLSSMSSLESRVASLSSIEERLGRIESMMCRDSPT